MPFSAAQLGLYPHFMVSITGVPALNEWISQGVLQGGVLYEGARLAAPSLSEGGKSSACMYSWAFLYWLMRPHMMTSVYPELIQSLEHRPGCLGNHCCG